ncbi:heat-inducible transcriptional repressor HrcA [Butyrivibrio sp. MC2021]|uniref:heat-inducible transcriptional repressor HrcA n=1 Tax=Butyrivibrio sp. MC2021 TaxID=1408306 RepID=UPI000686D403
MPANEFVRKILRKVNDLELDERKRTILHAIVKNYLETGEPVGSRTISKYTDLNLSSATIRNEMADLEEMGLILQPHTSAGRIPSDQGYRVYVDEMLRDKEQEVENMKEMLLDKEEKLENLLKQVAKTLAVDTNYATMISAPQIRKNKLKFIQISKVDDEHLLATIVIEGNVIKNKIIPVEEVLDDATMLKLNILMNTRLDGLAVEDINLGLIAAVKQEAGIHSEIIGNVIDAAAESITADEDLQIYTSGTMNIFKYPELTDNAKASELISTFEDTRDLSSIVEGTLANEAEETGIQVYIGNETPVQAMKDCSVVTATYELGDGMKGTVGIIGPKRMDYDKVITTLKNMRHALDDLYKKS